MTYVKIPLAAGVFKDESPLKAKGFFVDASWARVHRNGMETMGGYEYATTSTFLGICRKLRAWQDNDAGRHIFAGTHLRTYSYSDAQIYDITPAISRGELSNPFTTNGTATVTVTHSSHGLITNQKVKFANASAVSGVTVNGDYVITYVDANTYTIVVSSSASGSATGGGTVDYTYYLAPGNEDGTGGAGWGTGAYSVGTWGSPSTETLYLRTWSADPWGETILYSPRGGSLYEFNPTGDGYETSPTEKVTNGAFASDSDWTKGTGWSIGSGVATGSTASTALSQNLTLNPASWYLLDFDIATRTNGTLQPAWGGSNIGSALNAAGTYKTTFYSGAGGTQSFTLTGASFSGTVDNVSVKQLNCGNIVTNAPTDITTFFVTNERFVVCCGVNDSDGNFDPRLIKWSSQGNNTSWTPTAANTAGDYTLPFGDRIVKGIVTRNENIIFTTDTTWSMKFVADPTVVYRFQNIAKNAGCIGANAAVSTDVGVFWMAPGGEFYKYAGGVVQPIMSPVRRDVFDNLDFVQHDKIYAFSNAVYNEVGWYYADQRDVGNECSRYVLYNYVENKWSTGQIVRTAQIDRSIEAFPFAADASGYLYYMEKGDSANGGNLDGFLTTGYIDFGDGNTDMLLNQMIPDFDDLAGGLSVTAFAKNSPNGTPLISGPHNVTAATEYVPMRLRGRSFQFKFEWNDAPSFFRLGAIRFDFRQIGQDRPAA